jgi:choline/glycine/proline betaine transport protein
MIANLSTKGGSNESDSPIWLRIFWSVVITIVSIGLLLAGSFHSMQSAVVLCGLPFSVIILLYMFGLTKAINQDLASPQPPQAINKTTDSSELVK